MARIGGNPNIMNVQRTGPITKIGKLRNSLHGLKTGDQINKDSKVAKFVGFDGTKEKLQAYHNFVSFVLDQPIKSLSEIERLEGMLAVLEKNLTDVIERQDQGKPITDKDRKDMFLMKDTLVDLHKLKYGEKRLNVTASYKDIRDAMFEE